MSLQTIIDSAVSVEINKSKLAAQTMSRSGRLLTASRNWGNPWRFVVSPKPIWEWSTSRSVIEPVMDKDRVVEQTFQLGQSSGSSWLVAYQGTAATSGGVITGVTAASIAGNQLTVNVSGLSTGTVIVKAGDIIQFAGTGSDSLDYRYPYCVTEDCVLGAGETTKIIYLHRGYIAQTNYNPFTSTNSQNTIKVGTACKWYVQVTTMPALKMLPGKFAEFTSEFGLTEVIL